jgi:hypothetical protein
MHLMEDYRDWNRALDGESDAFYIPNFQTLSDDQPADLLEGMRENRWVVSAGVRDLEEALASGRLDRELYEEFDGGLLRLDVVDGYAPDEGLEVALGLIEDPASVPPERFGARLDALTFDWMVLFVEQPIRDRETALELAPGAFRLLPVGPRTKHRAVRPPRLQLALVVVLVELTAVTPHAPDRSS